MSGAAPRLRPAQVSGKSLLCGQEGAVNEERVVRVVEAQEEGVWAVA